MFWSVIIIILFIGWAFLEWYQLRYFFETNYLTTAFSEEAICCKKMTLQNKATITNIAWSDIASASLIQGFDSRKWWYRNIKQRLGAGIYTRLVLQTKARGAFVFHLHSKPTLSTLNPLYKKISSFSKNSELLSELEKHHIFVKKSEVSLVEAVTDNEKDWYRKM